MAGKAGEIIRYHIGRSDQQEVCYLPAESDLWSKCIKAIQKRRKFLQRCGDFLFLLFPVKSGSVNSQRAGSFTELSLVFVNDSLNILQAKGSA